MQVAGRNEELRLLSLISSILLKTLSLCFIHRVEVGVMEGLKRTDSLVGVEGY
jgi:hypothetical protein